jgi:ABC-2 type transport system ATP-binding protein
MSAQGVTIMVTTHYMDEAELCQRVGFISQGRLLALDSPESLKLTEMRGRVLEINTPEPDRAMRILKAAQSSGKLPLAEVALYGAQIHAVLPGSAEDLEQVRQTLSGKQITIRSLEWIAPTLEDVFISSVKA